MAQPARPARSWLRPVLTYGFYALLLIFLGLYLASIDLSTLRGLTISWGALAVATVLALGFRYWGAYIWTTLLRSLGAENVRYSSRLIYVYAKSWLGRYIPGTAPWILGKIYFAAEQGVSRSKLAVSSLLEAALQILVQLLFAFALLLLDPRLDIVSGQMRLVAGMALLASLSVLTPKVFNTLFGVAYRVVRKQHFPAEHHVRTATLAKGFVLYVLGAVLSSLSLFFIAKAVYPELPYSQILFVMGVSTLAGAVSMLAVFAPGGIGVREGIQIALLSIIMPTEYALVISVATRLHSVLIDVAFFLLARVHPGRRGATAPPLRG